MLQRDTLERAGSSARVCRSQAESRSLAGDNPAAGSSLAGEDSPPSEAEETPRAGPWGSRRPEEALFHPSLSLSCVQKKTTSNTTRFFFFFPPPSTMQFAVVFAVCVALAAAAPLSEFESFKATFNKSYKSPAEEQYRRMIFEENSKYIEQFNKEGHSYTLAMNEFGDLTNAQFQKFHQRTLINADTMVRTGTPFQYDSKVAVPDSIDWRSHGAVTPVKNQGQCGSCWAFSTTGSLEGQHYLKTKTLVSLSEQNLVDCSQAEGNQGCNGGLMDDAFNYIKKNNGIDTELSYPYTARDGSCHFNAANVGATLTSHVDVPSKNEDALKQAVGTVGPVSVAIDASHSSFQFYKNGVYDPAICSSTRLDHGVLAAGYGTDGSKDYWLVKNSWGVSWGQEGYIWMIRNSGDKCGIATSASYPVV
eukprot:m.86374 g.86374  ORF g.86374 m.86374 type:complete len:419 (+) comp17957_c1_seq1:1267-2523(+)